MYTRRREGCTGVHVHPPPQTYIYARAHFLPRFPRSEACGSLGVSDFDSAPGCTCTPCTPPARPTTPAHDTPPLTLAEYHALVRLAARINALTAKHGIAPAERLARAELTHNQPRAEDTR